MKHVFMPACAAAAAGILLFASGDASFAAQQTAKSDSAHQVYEHPRDSGPAGPACKNDSVLKSFRVFCEKWYQEKQKNCKKNGISCKRTPSACIAEYTRSAADFSVRIKETKAKQAPYIGILKYHETLYNCTAQTCEEASAGPFTRLSEYPVSEIFLYKNGKWQY